jgi:hypothetical protein
MATPARPAEHPARVRLRLPGGVKPERLVQLWEKHRAAHDGDDVAAALVLVRILGRETCEATTVQLGRVNAQVAEWRRQNPGAVKALPRLRLTRLPRRGHVEPRVSRPRARGMARSSSRGGDSGASSDDPEPARPGDRVGDTSRVIARARREGATP